MEKVIGAASPNHFKQMECLRAFVGADTITYKDLGNGEDYTLSKGGKELVISARYNKVDGGFLAVDDGEIWKDLRKNRKNVP